MRLGNYLLYHDKAYQISKNKIWCFFDFNGAWLYTDESLLRLVYIIITEWRRDRHLVG